MFAKRMPKERLTTLLHHFNVGYVGVAFYSQRRKAALGPNGVLWQGFMERQTSRVPQPIGRNCKPDFHGRMRAWPSCAGPRPRGESGSASGLDLPFTHIASLSYALGAQACEALRLEHHGPLRM